MKLPSNKKLGLNMVSMLGILGTAQTTTTVTRHTSQLPGEKEYPTLFPFFPHDFAVPAKNHQEHLSLSIRDMTTAIQHRYLHTPLQPVGDKQFAAIKALEQIFCPDHPAQTIPAQPPSVAPAPIQPIVELPTANLPAQLSQQSAPFALSPLSQE